MQPSEKIVTADFLPATRVAKKNGVGLDGEAWPFSIFEHELAVEKFCDHFFPLIRGGNGISPREKNLLLALLPPLVNETIRLYYGIKLSEIMRANNMMPGYGKESGVIGPCDRCGELKPLMEVEAFKQGVLKMSGAPALLRWMRGLFLKDGFSRKMPSMLTGNEVALTFSNGPILKDVLTRTNGTVVLSRWQDWFPDGALDQKTLPKGLGRETANLIAGYVCDSIAPESEEKIGFILQHIKSFFDDLTPRIQFYINALNKNKDKLPSVFWAYNLGNFFDRIFALAVKDNKGKVISFDHGEGFGWLTGTYDTEIVQFPYADTFYAYTPEMAEGYSRYINAKRLVASDHLEIIAPTSSVRNNLENKSVEETKSDTDQTKRVLLMGPCPLNENFSLIHCIPEILLEDLFTKVADTLGAANYDVILKPHPSSKIMSSPALLNSQYVQVEYRKFLKVLRPGDVVIFTWLASTTFREALLSDCNVVFIDFDQCPISDDYRKLLGKRVSIVKARLKKNKWIEIDVEKLMVAVEDSRLLRDRAFETACWGKELVNG